VYPEDFLLPGRLLVLRKYGRAQPHTCSSPESHLRLGPKCQRLLGMCPESCYVSAKAQSKAVMRLGLRQAWGLLGMQRNTTRMVVVEQQKPSIQALR
jgi:hypothetical protein